jgi:hypothetical protein
MSTATATVEQSPASEIKARLSALSGDLDAQVESILESIADGTDASPEDIGILRLAGFTDKDMINREVSRIKNVREWQRKAGSKADRDQAEQALTEAEQARDQRLPEIQEAINKLESEKLNLVEDVRQKERAYQDQIQAVEVLQREKVLPAHVRAAYRVRRNQHNDRWRDHLQRCQHIDSLQANLAKTDAELKVHYDVREIARQQPNKYGEWEVAREHINQFRRDCEAKLSELLPQVERDDPAYQQSVSDLAAILEYYVPD